MARSPVFPAASVLAALAVPLAARAAIVVNEIHYNSPGATDVEYVELTNSGAAPVDLTGWYLLDEDDAHARCFLSGTLGPGEFLVVAGFVDLFSATYPGVTRINPDEFDSLVAAEGFGLGNATDQVRLFDAAGVPVDAVVYTDSAPWPTAPDGGGPSLELRHPGLDNALASSWTASVGGSPGGTPGAQNSTFVPDPAPVLAGIARDVALPRVTDTVRVTVTASDNATLAAVELWLDSGAGFAAQPMYDDGLHGDGAAGDAVFGAVIPPLPSGTLVRYYVVAIDSLGQSTSDPAVAPADFHAYTVDHVSPPLRIHEILTSNQAGLVDEYGDFDDWLELRNPGPSVVELGGMFLTDDPAQPRKWQLPAHSLAAGEHLIVWCDGETAEGPLHASFALARAGGRVELVESVVHGNVPIHALTYGLQNTDVSFGYLPDDADAPEYLASPTPGAANGASTLFTPVCINEFLAGSQVPGAPDWIELHNRGPSTLDLGGWCLSDDATTPAKYVFPAGTTIAPGGLLSVDSNQLGFALAVDGSEALLLTSAGGTVGRDWFDFGAQSPDVSQGRLPDGTANWHFFAPSSRDLPNACPTGIPALGPVTGLRFDTPAALSWSPLAGADVYDIVVGDLGVLSASGGDFAAAVSACGENNGSDTAAWASAVPPAGHATFYLARGANRSCRFGTYDSGGPGQLAARDPGIDGAVAACP